MPCSDVTENLVLSLSEEDQLLDYHLTKRTCGRAVGEARLLADALLDQPAAALLDLPLDDFLEANPVASEEERFLQLKHLFAVQSGLSTLLGLEPGGKEDPVRVARIGFDEGVTVLEAELSVDVLTEKIRSCGKCKGCGSLKLAGK